MTGHVRDLDVYGFCLGCGELDQFCTGVEAELVVADEQGAVVANVPADLDWGDDDDDKAATAARARARALGVESRAREPVRASGTVTPDAVHDTFHRWLGDEYDDAAVDMVLVTAAVERLDGDPLWTLLLSGSGNAKTETVQALYDAGAPRGPRHQGRHVRAQHEP